MSRPGWRLLLLPALCPVLAGCQGLLGLPDTRPSPVRKTVAAGPYALFPRATGTVWRYEGFAEYAHSMELKRSRLDRGRFRAVQRIEGSVEDVSGGESDRDFRFALEYSFTPTEVRERILYSDTPFPHRVRDLVLLRLPLAKGHRWTQRVRLRGENRWKTLRAEMLKAEGPAESRAYTVRYRVPMRGMPGGVYEEVRVIKAGVGVERFENTFGPQPEERFGYGLFQITRPYGKMKALF